MNQCIVALLCAGAATGLVCRAEENETPARGLVRNEGGMAPGFTLISPFSSTNAFLLNDQGQVVHQWKSRYNPGLAPYLLPNGHLIRGIQAEAKSQFQGGGISGGLQEFSWDGQLLWEFHLASDLAYHHHDIAPLPNGNILMVAWEPRTKDQALRAGRRPSHAGDQGLWPEVVVEIEPQRPLGGRVVWQWHAWDHLVQDADPQLPNFGVVRDHPERVDINGDIPDANDDTDGDDQSNQRENQRGDWLHVNGIDYNAELDQIVLSSWYMSEIWIIDHSTTTAQAAGSSGGRAGRGGDLLYRWGNPQNYNAGTGKDRKLFHQHDARWIPAGYPGAGNVTIFNNGRGRPEKEFSMVLEIKPPLQADGTYARAEGEPFGPAAPEWQYNPGGEDQFFASFISGAHRLKNGNTLICSGPQGRVFEVTVDGEILWEYLNPYAEVPESGEPNELGFAMFRATRIEPDHPALQGRELTPLDPQPATVAQQIADRPAPGDTPSGWLSLTHKDRIVTRWAFGNFERETTFRAEPNPDNDDEIMPIATGNPPGMLRSDRMYENFIAEFQWRVEDNDEEANALAGILIWADALPAVGHPLARGIQIDIGTGESSSTSTSQGDIHPVGGAEMMPDMRFRYHGTRSMPQEDDFHVRPRGQWNQYRITALDGVVSLEVNGNLVSGGTRCRPSKGYVCLASLQGEVQFRNFRMWELPAGSHAADPTRTVRAAQGHQLLFGGLDLKGWNVRQGEWKVEAGTLKCEPGPGEIDVELPAGTTHLIFDFRRTNSGPESRLPLRLGSGTFDSTGERAGQWNRVHVFLTDTEAVVEFGGLRQASRRFEGDRPRLMLVDDGVSTEFRNILSATAGR